MAVEIKVKIKDDERKLEREFLIYDPVTFVESDPIIKKCVDETVEEFQGEPDDIVVRAMMVLK